MPILTLETHLADGVGNVLFAPSDSDHSRSLFGASSLQDHKAKQLELRLLTNNDDWSYCEPFDGLRLELRAEGITAEGKEGKYKLSVEGRLSWAQVKLLHTWMKILLRNKDRLEGVRDGPWEGTKLTELDDE